MLTCAMSLNGEYAPSTAPWVRDQVEVYEGSGGTSGTTMRGMPVIILTTLGAKSGKVRKVPLMRVACGSDALPPTPTMPTTRPRQSGRSRSSF